MGGTRPSYNLSKYWLYFHSQVIALFHYYNTAKVRNQHQLLTRVKLQNGSRYYFEKLLFSNYHQKLDEMLYLKHFRAF